MSKLYLTRPSDGIAGFVLLWTKNPRGRFDRKTKEWGVFARDNSILLTDAQARCIVGMHAKFPRVGTSAIHCYRFDITRMRKA